MTLFTDRWRLFLFPVLIFLLSATALVFVQKPDEDEALHTNASYNLAYHKFMGITVWAQRDEKKWQNWDKHFLAVPPVAIVTEAVWFKVAGFGLFRLRALAVLFGLAGLFSWFVIFRKMELKDKSVFIGLLLLGADFIYTRQSANGRVFDVMCAALTFASWASYLYYREKSLTTALVASNSLIVLSGLTHPNGIAGLAGLVYIALLYDRQKLTLKNMSMAVLPYLAGAAAWGSYIIPNWDDFKAQFFGAVTGYGGGFWEHPMENFVREIRDKYLLAYGFSADFPFYARVLIAIPLFYLFSFVYSAKNIKLNVHAKAVFGLTLLNLVLFTFLIHHKYPLYLVHTIPLFAMCAAFLWDGLNVGSFARRLTSAAVIVIVLMSSGVNVYRVARDELHNKYLPEITEILKIIPPQSTITAHCELAFFTGYERLTDDFSLGFFSKKNTDFIIVGEIYQREFESYKRTDPAVYGHIKRKLANKYDLIYSGKLYKVYGRRLIHQHAA